MCRLKRALYGLKQTLRAWYAWIDNYLLNFGFTKTEVDPNLYYILVEGQHLILVLYVDDLMTRDEELIHDCKRNLAEEFEGYMAYALFSWLGGLAR